MWDCVPPRQLPCAALSSLGLLSTSRLLLGVDWSPPALAPSPLEPGLWEKAAGPPTAPRDVQCQCVAVQRSVHRVGMCPAPLLPSPKLGQKQEVSTAFYVQRVVPFFFFLEASFLTAPFTSREKHPQNMTVLLRRGGRAAVLGRNSPWIFGNVWGKTEKKRKKKSTYPSFRPQVSVSQHTPMVSTTNFISSGKEPRKAP